jgi:hypothetical protein
MEKNKSKDIILNLPDVEDIPGQENIRPPKMREMEDTTISSEDEEGEHLFKTDDDFLNDLDKSNVSEEEKKILRDASEYNSVEEENELKDAMVDRTDGDNDPLNETISYKDLGAQDLDIPDDFEDDDDEELGK